MDGISTGRRVRNARKQRGMTQVQLAAASGLSRTWIQAIERDDETVPRVETLLRIARALKIPTSSLSSRGDAEAADAETAEDWADVREALYGQPAQPDEPVTEEGVLAALMAMRPALAANKYAGLRPVLPHLIRDVQALNGAGRVAASRVYNLTSWLLTQTRQWEAAAVAARLAEDAAQDRLDAASAQNTACWSLLRQGRLAEARDLAVRNADDIEPRLSRATVRELALWGRLLLGVVNAAVRDNRPGEAEDALLLARAAAHRIGGEVAADGSTTRTFGPASVEMIAAENAAISRQPDKVIEISQAIPPDLLHPASASRCRHRLDQANAYVMLRRYPEAMTMLQDLRRDAPEWLPQQRYARDILAAVREQRRTMTPEMQDLAAVVRLPV